MLLVLVLVILGILAVAAWFLSISMFIGAAKAKGYSLKEEMSYLWFVGFFATPIVIGLYVNALPNKTDK